MSMFSDSDDSVLLSIAQDSDGWTPELSGPSRRPSRRAKASVMARRDRNASTQPGSESGARRAKEKKKLSQQQRTPQETIDEFWSKFTTKTPGKATTIIPHNRYADKLAVRTAKKTVSSISSVSISASVPVSSPTQASYDDAAAKCRAKVDKIVRECRRINRKYRDPRFDLEADLKLGRRDCLESLWSVNIKGVKQPGHDLKPRSAKRVVDVFDHPQLYIDGPTANDVRQGRDGDCWLMAALCTLSNKEGLIERLCVAHDPSVGVYGFVFYRDGEWISEIVDDFLYLTKADYDEGYMERVLLDELERVNPEEAYRKIYQSNSRALYFAQCEHPQETWLPLLEKAYAKAHGDYAAIEGGFGGEGIEDLTGGVTSELFTSDILDKEYFWKEELLKVNQDFLFGCSTGVWGMSQTGEKKGILERHAYSIQKAVEMDGKRLLRLKNPWGEGEWKGAWSDGSKEWTPAWLEKLGHRFGDDGDFWIAYEDLLHKFQAFERTRLFGEDWLVTQMWTTLAVPWAVDYNDTHFSFSLSKPGSVVLVLSQLDDRYFRGLEGQYRLELAFRLHVAGQETYLVRSPNPYRMKRSVNVELELDKGDYDVRIKVHATRYELILPVEQVIRENAKSRREKLTRIGLAYDLAHGKGQVVESPEERKMREACDKRAQDKERGRIRDKILADREEAHYLKTKRLQRDMKKQRKAGERQQGRRPQKGTNHRMIRDAPESAASSGDDESTPANEKTRQQNGVHGREEIRKILHRNSSKGEALNQPNDSEDNSDTAGTMPKTNHREHTAREEVVTRHKVRREDSPVHADDAGSIEPLSDLSDRELDMHVEAYKQRTISRPPPDPDATDDNNNSQDEPDEFEKDPWNAVAVIGLRIYYKTSATAADHADVDGRDAAVKLKVVRPNPYSAGLQESAVLDGADRREEEMTEMIKGLDVDDSAKDATLEGVGVRREG